MRLTEEQGQLVAAAQGEPLEVVDPQTRQAYVLLPAELYQRLSGVVEAGANEAPRPAALVSQGQPLRVKVRDLAMPAVVDEIGKIHCKRYELLTQGKSTE